MVTGLRPTDYIGRLKELDMLALEERRLQTNVHMVHKIMNGYSVYDANMVRECCHQCPACYAKRN